MIYYVLYVEGKNMTPSKYIKSQGLPSLAYVAREAGVNARTLHNWYHDKFKLFEVVVRGCVMGQDQVKGVWQRNDKDFYLVVDTRVRCFTGTEIQTDKDKMGIVRQGLLYERENDDR